MCYIYTIKSSNQMDTKVIVIIDWDKAADFDGMTEQELRTKLGTPADVYVKHLHQKDTDYGGNGRAVLLSSPTLNRRELIGLATAIDGFSEPDFYTMGYEDRMDGTIPHLPSQTGSKELYTTEELDQYNTGWNDAGTDQDRP